MKTNPAVRGSLREANLGFSGRVKRKFIGQLFQEGQQFHVRRRGSAESLDGLKVPKHLRIGERREFGDECHATRYFLGGPGILNLFPRDAGRAN